MLSIDNSLAGRRALLVELTVLYHFTLLPVHHLDICSLMPLPPDSASKQVAHLPHSLIRPFIHLDRYWYPDIS